MSNPNRRQRRGTQSTAGQSSYGQYSEYASQSGYSKSAYSKSAYSGSGYSQSQNTYGQSSGYSQSGYSKSAYSKSAYSGSGYSQSGYSGSGYSQSGYTKQSSYGSSNSGGGTSYPESYDVEDDSYSYGQQQQSRYQDVGTQSQGKTTAINDDSTILSTPSMAQSRSQRSKASTNRDLDTSSYQSTSQNSAQAFRGDAVSVAGSSIGGTTVADGGRGRCPYQIEFSVTNTGKQMSTSKRIISFRFGFADSRALMQGKAGVDCRGAEHDVIVSWSITGGKRSIHVDGREIHFQAGKRGSSHANPSQRADVFEAAWRMPEEHVCSLTCYAFKPSMGSKEKKDRNWRQYNLVIDGRSFFDLPQIYDLGLKGLGPTKIAAELPPLVIEAIGEEMEGFVAPVAKPKNDASVKKDVQSRIQAQRNLLESRKKQEAKARRTTQARCKDSASVTSVSTLGSTDSNLIDMTEGWTFAEGNHNIFSNAPSELDEVRQRQAQQGQQQQQQKKEYVPKVHALPAPPPQAAPPEPPQNNPLALPAPHSQAPAPPPAQLEQQPQSQQPPNLQQNSHANQQHLVPQNRGLVSTQKFDDMSLRTDVTVGSYSSAQSQLVRRDSSDLVRRDSSELVRRNSNDIVTTGASATNAMVPAYPQMNNGNAPGAMVPVHGHLTHNNSAPPNSAIAAPPHQLASAPQGEVEFRPAQIQPRHLPHHIQHHPNQMQHQPHQIQHQPHQMQHRPYQIQSLPNQMQHKPPQIQHQPNQMQHQPRQIQPQPLALVPETQELVNVNQHPPQLNAGPSNDVILCTQPPSMEEIRNSMVSDGSSTSGGSSNKFAYY